MEDFYNIIISPETIKGDLFTVNLQGNNVGPNYSGETIGIYSGMTQVLTGGNEGSSLLTGLTIPILFKQTAIDVGYFSPFDGAILQKDIVANFIFSSTTLHQLRRLPPLFPFLIHSTKTSLPLWYSRNFPPYSLIKVHVKAIPKMPPLAAKKYELRSVLGQKSLNTRKYEPTLVGIWPKTQPV